MGRSRRPGRTPPGRRSRHGQRCSRWRRCRRCCRHGWHGMYILPQQPQQQCRGQRVLPAAFGQRTVDLPAQRALPQSGHGRVDGRQPVGQRRVLAHHPVARMHHLARKQAHPQLAEGTDQPPGLQLGQLRGVEVQKAQLQLVRAIADPDLQHAPAPRHLRTGDGSLDLGRGTMHQRRHRHQPGLVLVAQRQVQDQIVRPVQPQFGQQTSGRTPPSLDTALLRGGFGRFRGWPGRFARPASPRGLLRPGPGRRGITARRVPLIHALAGFVHHGCAALSACWHALPWPLTWRCPPRHPSAPPATESASPSGHGRPRHARLRCTSLPGKCLIRVPALPRLRMAPPWAAPPPEWSSGPDTAPGSIRP